MTETIREGSGGISLTISRNQIIEISNKFEVFSYDLGTGRFSITVSEKNGASVKGGYASVLFADGGTARTSDKWLEKKWDKKIDRGSQDERLSLVITSKGATDQRLHGISLVLTAEVFANSPKILLRVELTSNGERSLRIREFQPLVVQYADGGSLTLGSSTRNWRFLKNGYQTSSPCYSLSLTELDKTCPVEYFRRDYNPRSKYRPVKGEYDSEWMTAFKDNSTGNSAIIGFVTMKDNMCQVDFGVDEGQNEIVMLRARSISDDIENRDGRSISSEKLLVDMLGSINTGLDRYAQTVAEEMSSVPWKRVLTGWCSWYELYDKISEQLVLDIVEYYRRNREKFPIEYIQVDDGYFNHRGDWTTPNESFPHGMKFIADKIREAGFKPGIWLSPFQISDGSKLFQEHPDWTIRDEKGKPIAEGFDASMKHSYYGLDCTNPEVIDWLRSLFKTITRDWGYEYVKIDFLYAASIDGKRYDRNTTRAQALRRGLEAIREAMGEEIPLLGCLAPIGQAVGIVNSYRVSPDTATRWKPPWPFGNGPALRDAMRNTVLRYFMHNKFWSNDPDCVIVRRGKDRSEYPKSAEIEFLSQGGTISEDEVRFEITVLGILGGSLIYSDDPIHLPPERGKYLPLLLPAYQGKAKVVDLLESDLPTILTLEIKKVHHKWDLVGLLNWDDSARDIELELGRIGLKEDEYYHAFSFWEEEYLGIVKGKLVIKNVPAHSASLLSIREVLNIPQLISTSIHVTQGGVEVDSVSWKEEVKTLEVRLRRPGKTTGRLFFYVPPSFRINSVAPRSARTSLKTRIGDAALIVVELDFEQSATVSLKFD